MWKKRASRSGWENTPYCPNCNHVLSGYCTCENCEQERREKDQKHQEESINILNDYYNVLNQKKRVEVKLLPIIDRLYLSAFLRYVNEDHSDFLECNNQSNKLSPNSDFDEEILIYLLRNSYLKICKVEQAIPGYFTPDDYCESVKLTTLTYQLNIYSECINIDELHSILYYPQIERVDENELRRIWIRIGVEEGIEYVQFNFKRLGLKLDVSDKQRKHIENILNTFSVGQFFFFFYKSLERATLKLQAGEIYNRQCVNYAIKGAVNYAERAIANKWDVSPYHRWDMEQSVISQVFYSVFLGIDTKGFYECPNTYDFMDKGISLKIVNDKGLLVFGSSKKYATWLDEECIGLDNLKPSELLINSEGLEKVYIMLLRLDTGVYN